MLGIGCSAYETFHIKDPLSRVIMFFSQVSSIVYAALPINPMYIYDMIVDVFCCMVSINHKICTNFWLLTRHECFFLFKYDLTFEIVRYIFDYIFKN